MEWKQLTSARLLSMLAALMWVQVAVAATNANQLRGSNGSGRSWWDVRRYHLDIQIDTASKSIAGRVQVFFKVLGKANDSMQIDLQQPMELDSVFYVSQVRSSKIANLKFVRQANVYWLLGDFSKLEVDSVASVTLYYHGKPRAAKNAPWDGGFTWTTDADGRAWVAVSCQGLGASVWWPCKDAQWDEPENGMHIGLTVPNTLVAISNGRLSNKSERDGWATYMWDVKHPINNYDVTCYIGNYTQWTDTLIGEQGKLDLSYYVLKYNVDKAKKQFEVVKPMLRCFEYWLGAYPFYEDGYKLVEAPYLGMEHQSAVAYGNDYKMGYKGTDRSGTGHGLLWDYIVIHESGHEWFGNSVTAKDIADNWIHEGFTSYTEVLYTECATDKAKAMEYSLGLRRLIRNDKPLIGPYGVNEEGSGDIYEKGAAVVHMIRTMMNNDKRFRALLRGINKKFYHQTISTADLEAYIMKESGLELKAFFEQYLRTATLPVLEYAIKDGQLSYRFTNSITGFALPIQVKANGGKWRTLSANANWQSVKWDGGYDVQFSKDYLYELKQ